MKCNYKNIQCPYKETGGSCEACEHYENGVRETGATPVLAEFLDMIKRIWNEIKKL